MQLKRYLLFTLLWAYVFAVPLAAQEKIVKITDLKESNTTLSNANEAIVLVKSAIEDIEVKTKYGQSDRQAKHNIQRHFHL